MACDTHYCCASKGSILLDMRLPARSAGGQGTHLCRLTDVAALQGVSFFGGSELRQSQVEELANAELLAGNDRMVVLSDVWLDSPEVMDQLQTLFTGLHQCCSPVLAREWCSILGGPMWQHMWCT